MKDIKEPDSEAARFLFAGAWGFSLGPARIRWQHPALGLLALVHELGHGFAYWSVYRKPFYVGDVFFVSKSAIDSGGEEAPHSRLAHLWITAAGPLAEILFSLVIWGAFSCFPSTIITPPMLLILLPAGLLCVWFFNSGLLNLLFHSDGQKIRCLLRGRELATVLPETVVQLNVLLRQQIAAHPDKKETLEKIAFLITLSSIRHSARAWAARHWSEYIPTYQKFLLTCEEPGEESLPHVDVVDFWSERLV
jgi:hypothetical protein